MTEKSFSGRSQLTFDSQIANAIDVWAVESPSARMEAREGEIHGLVLDYCLPSRSGGECAGGTEVLPRARKYHNRFSNSQRFLILFCKEFQNGTDLHLCRLVIEYSAKWGHWQHLPIVMK